MQGKGALLLKAAVLLVIVLWKLLPSIGVLVPQVCSLRAVPAHALCVRLCCFVWPMVPVCTSLSLSPTGKLEVSESLICQRA